MVPDGTGLCVCTMACGTWLQVSTPGDEPRFSEQMDLLEACLKFIDDTPKGDALRVAAYEFTYAPVIEALKRAIDRKVELLTLDDFTANHQRQYIRHVLDLCRGNVSKTARALGVARGTLQRKLKQLSIASDGESEAAD